MKAMLSQPMAGKTDRRNCKNKRKGGQSTERKRV